MLVEFPAEKVGFGINDHRAHSHLPSGIQAAQKRILEKSGPDPKAFHFFVNSQARQQHYGNRMAGHPFF